MILIIYSVHIKHRLFVLSILHLFVRYVKGQMDSDQNE